MRALTLTTLMLLVTGLAGCSNAPEATGDPVAQAALTVPAPEWVVGQHWSYRTEGGSAGAGAIKLVVTSSTGTDWIVDTNDAELAYYDDLIDVSYVGKIRKTDLAGAQGADRVKFFDFPLTMDKTWSTKWDGKQQDVTVKQIMPNGNVQLMAHDANGMTAEYEYSAQAGFLETITFYDENGTAGYKMERTDHGTAYVGSALRYEILDPVVIAVGPLTVHQETASFGDANQIRLLMHAFCNGDPAGMILMGIGPKDEDAVTQVPPVPIVLEPDYGMTLDCSQGQVSILDEGLITIEPGEAWTFDVLPGSPNGEALIVVQPRILETLSGPFA